MTLSSPPARLTGSNWLTDFELGPTGLVVRKTGARVPYSPAVIAETLSWIRFFLAVRAAPRPAPAEFSVGFYPDRARPWYLIWPTLRLAGARVVEDCAQADVVIHFDDATLSPAAPPKTRPDALLINAGCTDVSKSRVARVFGDVFGYSLTVDPLSFGGVFVEKSETNGAHDGLVVTRPMEPKPGKTYQRLIDNRSQNPGLVEDFRTPTIGGRPAVVFVKRRPLAQRFANANTEVAMRHPDEVFSADEQVMIERFAAGMGLDWGGLDVLRDVSDGRLYIVDANKTDMGPPTALPLEEKLEAARRLAGAFRAFVGQQSHARGAFGRRGLEE